MKDNFTSRWRVRLADIVRGRTWKTNEPLQSRKVEHEWEQEYDELVCRKCMSSAVVALSEKGDPEIRYAGYDQCPGKEPA